jgi:two-component sensor histidine kinase
MSEPALAADTFIDDQPVLLLEMTHRWFNGLQVLGAALRRCRSQDLSADDMRARLLEIDNQVQAVATLHRRLSSPPGDAETLQGFCRAVCEDVFAAFARADVSPELEICEAQLAPPQRLRLGLIVAELVTNALKHGAPTGGAVTLRMTLRPWAANWLELATTDSFTPPASSIASGTPRVLAALVENVGGRLIVRTTPHYATRIQFPPSFTRRFRD